MNSRRLALYQRNPHATKTAISRSRCPFSRFPRTFLQFRQKTSYERLAQQLFYKIYLQNCFCPATVPDRDPDYVTFWCRNSLVQQWNLVGVISDLVRRHDEAQVISSSSSSSVSHWFPCSDRRLRAPCYNFSDSILDNFFFGGRFAHSCLRPGSFRRDYRDQFRKRP